jgi:hypothetical protein
MELVAVHSGKMVGAPADRDTPGTKSAVNWTRETIGWAVSVEQAL